MYPPRYWPAQEINRVRARSFLAIHTARPVWSQYARMHTQPDYSSAPSECSQYKVNMVGTVQSRFLQVIYLDGVLSNTRGLTVQGPSLKLYRLVQNGQNRYTLSRVWCKQSSLCVCVRLFTLRLLVQKINITELCDSIRDSLYKQLLVFLSAIPLLSLCVCVHTNVRCRYTSVCVCVCVLITCWPVNHHRRT